MIMVTTLGLPKIWVIVTTFLLGLVSQRLADHVDPGIEFYQVLPWQMWPGRFPGRLYSVGFSNCVGCVGGFFHGESKP